MYAQKKSIDNVHIVRERDRQRLRELVTVVLTGLPIGLFLALFTYQNLEVIRLGHESTRLQKRRAAIENENKALQLELDRSEEHTSELQSRLHLVCRLLL